MCIKKSGGVNVTILELTYYYIVMKGEIKRKKKNHEERNEFLNKNITREREM